MASGTIAAVGQTNLGNAGEGSVSTKVIQFKPQGGFTGSITVKARKRLPGKVSAFLPVSYRKRYLNGAVSDETFGSAPITGESLIEVNAAGVDIQLDTTALSAGTMDYDTEDLLG